MFKKYGNHRNNKVGVGVALMCIICVPHALQIVISHHFVLETGQINDRFRLTLDLYYDRVTVNQKHR